VGGLAVGTPAVLTKKLKILKIIKKFLKKIKKNLIFV